VSAKLGRKKFIVGAIMKKVILSVLAVGSLSSYAGAAAHAGQNDDVIARIETLEKKVAALSEEKNAALRENQVLRQQNATLKPATRPQAAAGQSAAAPNARRSDPLRAYASAPPMTYKGRIAEARGQLRVWGEGGATWAGGDPNLAFYNKQDFTQNLVILPGGTNGIPVGMNVRPSLGYEGAAGFDYRFAESPWHVSGQFRYGEGRGNAAASSIGNVDAATIAAVNAAIGPTGINGGPPSHSWLAPAATRLSVPPEKKRIGLPSLRSVAIYWGRELRQCSSNLVCDWLNSRQT
jgi:hypothetical protein